jgi:hypothetical protein
MRAHGAFVVLAVVAGTASYAQAPDAELDPCWGGQREVGVRGMVIDAHHPYFDAPVVVPSDSTRAASPVGTPPPGAPSVPSGIGKPEALLVVAVLVAAALPLVLYAVDGEPDQRTLWRYRCPSFEFRLLTGAVTGPGPGELMTPLFGTRWAFTVGAFGLAASLESSADRYSFGTADALLLLRPPPKAHMELAVSLGYRRALLGGEVRNGFELGLPHRYVLGRFDGRPLGFEVTPAVFIGPRGPDFRLEASFTAPLGPLSLLIGGRAFSFDQEVRSGGHVQLGVGI